MNYKRSGYNALLLIMIAVIASVALSACGGGSSSNEPANADNGAIANESGENKNGESSANENVDPDQPDGNIEEIKFKPGATSAGVGGKVEGYDRKDFSFRAQKGQNVSVKLASANTSVYFNISDSKDGFALETDPRPLDVRSWNGTLPKDGDYFIRVYLVRAAARREEKADFTLDVSIKGDENDESAGGVEPVTFDCPDKMDVVVTYKEVGGKEMAELEVGDTVLRLELQSTSAGSKYVEPNGSNMFWVNGTSAIFTYKGRTIGCTEKVKK